MSTEIQVPQGEQLITVELSVKEAIALSGFRFNQDSELLAVARRKVRRTLDRTFLPETDKVHYHTLKL